MHALSAIHAPARLAGLPLAQGPRAFARGSGLGQVGVVEPAARRNLIAVTTGVAMAAGGIYALLNVPGAKRVSQFSLGALGGALLLSGMLSVYDGLD